MARTPAPADVVTLRRKFGLFGAPRTVYRLLARSRRRRLFQAKRRLYGRFVSQGDLCFDIGANVGDRTRVLRSIGARVVAVEPQAGCVDWMRREFRRDPHVEIVASAAGATIGSATMQTSSTMNPLSTLNPTFVERMSASQRFDGIEWDAVVKVPVTTLDDLVAHYGRPRFCKVDVEGYEDKVFAGLSEAIDVVSFEYNEELPAPAAASALQLATLGLSRFNVSLGETMELLWPTWRDAGAVLEFLEAHIGALPHSYGDIYATTLA